MEAEKKPGSELRLAAKNGRDDVVANLLTQGVPVDSRDGIGWTPLMLASKYGRKSTVALLVHAGADINTTNARGKSVWSYAIQSGCPEIVQILVKAVCNANPDPANLSAPLYQSVMSGSTEMTKLLLNAGALFDYRGDNGRRLVKRAKSIGSRDMVALLRAYGASDPAEDSGSRWTIANSVKREIRMHINTSGMPLWCAYDVEVLPAPECDGVEIELAHDANADSVQWFPPLLRGIQKGREQERKRGDEWVGIRIVVLQIYAHPISTTERACEYYGQSLFHFLEWDATRLQD